uniref:Uncharacterized protein n=1 Tax=Caulobacter sp. (strain K31) TaxID=366602 RepID=B0T5T6_CAUSK
MLRSQASHIEPASGPLLRHVTRMGQDREAGLAASGQAGAVERGRARGARGARPTRPKIQQSACGSLLGGRSAMLKAQILFTPGRALRRHPA